MKNSKRDNWGGTSSRQTNGFSIPEVLAVVAIIIILLGLLLPSMQASRRAAWRGECASNQHQIHILMQGNKLTDGVRTIPDAGSWVLYVRDKEKNAAKILQCPIGRDTHGRFGGTDGSAGTPGGDGGAGPGDANGDGVPDGFEEVYSVQVSGATGTTFSYVSDILAGHVATDPQLGRQYQGGFIGDFGESGTGWPEAAWGNPLSDSEMAVTYNDDGGYLVIMGGSSTTIHSLDAPGDTRCGSDHWICIGESGDEWRSEIVMQLTGNNHQNIVDPPVDVGLVVGDGGGDGGGTGGTDGSGGTIGGTSTAQYGMNNRIDPNRLRGDQILLMDYAKTVIKLSEEGNFLDDFDRKFAPRHFSQANVLRVDGSVSLMARGELDHTESIWHPRD